MTGKERVKFLYKHATLEAAIAQALEENFLSRDDRDKLVLLKKYEKSFIGLNYSRLVNETLFKYIKDEKRS